MELKPDKIPVADIVGPAMGLAIVERLLLKKNKTASKGKNIFLMIFLAGTKLLIEGERFFI